MAKEKEKAQKSSIASKIIGYFKGVRTELKRVTWPTRREMLNSGIIVIVTLVFFALFTFAFDEGATKGVTALSTATQPAAEASADSSNNASSAEPTATSGAGTTGTAAPAASTEGTGTSN